MSDGGRDLLLSGGWDSRGILAFLHSIGRLPRTATAWGRTKAIPLSDPYIAERLAARYRVPFKFVAKDSDQLLPGASSWCYLSELANDNLGWFAEGATLLAQSYATRADCTLVGDEAWGWHGHPRTERDARAAVLPPTLGAQLTECIVPAQREECRARYEAEIERVLADCANDHPADRRGDSSSICSTSAGSARGWVHCSTARRSSGSSARSSLRRLHRHRPNDLRGALPPGICRCACASAFGRPACTRAAAT